MPIYEYITQCDCQKRIETVTSVKDRNNPIEHNCVKCNKKVEAHRIFSSPLILSDDIGRGFKRMKDKDLYKELDMD
tara:strand:+ start:8284 stop:8511 length:228 start_codon:yes stop_codon:yes gene_type:complete